MRHPGRPTNKFRFQFRITPALVLEGMIFAIIVGIIGSFFPAIRAARLPVIAAPAMLA